MDDFSSREEFGAMIARTLRDRPDWLHAAVSAVVAGMERAQQQARVQHARTELALAAALILADKKRLTADTVAVMNAQIVKALPLEGASPAEMDAYVRYYAATHGGEAPVTESN